MFSFSNILSDLQKVIAAHAARTRALTVLLVAVWGRVARMRTRLERLVALWRAGKLPLPRAARLRQAAADKPDRINQSFPTTRKWLTAKLCYEAAAYGSQLRHLLTDAECAAFLDACPQAGRILRPLLRMLSGDPLPEVIQKVKRFGGMPAVAPVAEIAAGVVAPESAFLRA